MIIFLSGPVTYNPRRARRIFNRAARRLKRHGAVVLNPTLLPEGMEYEQYMTICETMLCEANAVCALPGYEQSKGSMREIIRAQYSLQLPIFFDIKEAIQWLHRSQKKKSTQ